MNNSLIIPIKLAWYFPLLCVLFTVANSLAEKSGDFTYTVNPDGTTITITDYTGTGGAVAIPSTIAGKPVTSIGNLAFRFCSGLTEVTIPNSIIRIGEEAFYSCTSLTSIRVDSNNPAYGSVDGVLFNRSLTTLIQCPGGQTGNYTIPRGVTNIADEAFSYCTSLTSVTIPDSVITIGAFAFYKCTSLISVTIPDSVITIGAAAFGSCHHLPGVTIPDSVTHLEFMTFSYCDNLISIYFDGNAPSADSSVFNHTDQTSVYYLSGTIGWESAFAGRPTALFPFAYSINPSNTATITNYMGLGGEVYIPSIISGMPVTAIGDSAFEDNATLTHITIGNGITAIGDSAFEYCRALTSITIPNSVTTIRDSAFESCIDLTHVTIPESVTNIGNWAFYDCTALTNVTIPDRITRIGNFIFYDCISLSCVTIPGSVSSIGNWAFHDCGALTSIYCQGNAPTLGSAVFGGANNATIYYVPAASGWDTLFGDRPAVPWNPMIQLGDGSFGVQTNSFGFKIDESESGLVVVEACATLIDGTWVPLKTNSMNHTSVYFSDADWINHPERYYRLSMP